VGTGYFTPSSTQSLQPMRVTDTSTRRKRSAAVDYSSTLLLLCVACFLIALGSTVDLANTDPRGSLLTAQALLQGHGIRLDEWLGEDDDPGFQFHTRGSHVYYNFPLGTSVVALPVVWMANLSGMDMARQHDERRLGNLLSAFALAGACALVFLIARRFVDGGASLLLAAVFGCASSMTSTLGLALFSIDLAVVFLLLVVLVLAGRAPVGSHPAWWGVLLGGIVFAAYLCRPTAAVAGMAIAVYLAVKERRQLPWYLLGFGLLFALFVLFSVVEFDQVLPDYYRSDRIGHFETFGVALFGDLASPSRGLLVFNPFLLPLAVVAAARLRHLARIPLFWLAAGWFLTPLAVVASFPHWWGGGSYGSRLLVDAFPALVLLVVLTWREAATLPHAVRTIGLVAFVVLAAIGVFINAYQGLYNPYTYAWNGTPSVDHYPETLFDWRYPQFLASPSSLRARELEHTLSLRGFHDLEVPLAADCPEGVFHGWSAVEWTPDGAFRWSDARVATIAFKARVESAPPPTAVLAIRAGALERQLVDLYLNGRQVGVFVVEGRTPSVHQLTIDRRWLNSGTNVLEFRLPDAHTPVTGEPGYGDSRMLGISFWSAEYLSGGGSEAGSQ